MCVRVIENFPKRRLPPMPRTDEGEMTGYGKYKYYIRVCMCACMYACMYVCMYVCICVCIYVCMCVCMYTCLYYLCWCEYNRVWHSVLDVSNLRIDLLSPSSRMTPSFLTFFLDTSFYWFPCCRSYLNIMRIRLSVASAMTGCITTTLNVDRLIRMFLLHMLWCLEAMES